MGLKWEITGRLRNKFVEEETIDSRDEFVVKLVPNGKIQISNLISHFHINFSLKTRSMCLS